MTFATNGQRAASDGIAIAGGGLAGQRCAEMLRRGGYEGVIRIACAEPHRPYDRPPLSKELLAGAAYGDGLGYRPEEWYGRHSVDLLLGVSATGLRADERRLLLSEGSSLRYEQLLICTGGRPRTLPMLTGYDNVSVLRTVDDALALRDALASQPRLAVIGAGFIGLEVAATARRLGVQVTLIEAAARPLVGVLGVELGDWFARLHAAEGVDVRTEVTVDAVEANGTVRALRLSDGSAVGVDHVVVGTGIDPDVGWLKNSGLDVSRGVPVDARGRTAVDRVFAAGDAAATFDESSRRHVPGSHWEAAGRQGMAAARAMLGLDPEPMRLTSFWTDQYGLRIQYIGDGRLADSIEIEGEPERRNFIATFYRAGRAIAALLVDRPRCLPAARRLIERKETDELLRSDR
jgi:3-phenylpropionate/trans-cinnamate dioxygenase ferredoxin reductase component